MQPVPTIFSLILFNYLYWIEGNTPYWVETFLIFYIWSKRNWNLSFQVDKILKVIPRDRRTFLFSATMTKKVDSSPALFCVTGCWCCRYTRWQKSTNSLWFVLQVQKLQRAALKDPVKCAVSTKYSTVDKLQQYYIFIPSKYKVDHTEMSILLSCFNVWKQIL